MADSKDSVLIQVKLGNDLKNQTSDSSKSDEACRDSEETTTCCQDVTDTLRFLIFDIKWFQVVYHISIIIAALYATFDFGRLLIKDIHAPIILTRLYTWTFGKSVKNSASKLLRALGFLGVTRLGLRN